jgi:hypothetical protein
MARAKKAVRQTQGSKSFLHLTVLQQGAPQISARVPLRGLLSRGIRVGRARRAELFVPFAQLPEALRLFRVGRGKASVFIDPRLEGFLNDGNRFGTVREFIAPRGSLRDLATVLEPLEVKLGDGARGTVRLGDYEILFRVDSRNDTPRLRSLPPGAGRSPLALPSSNDPLERHGVWIAGLAAALFLGPLVLWLLKAPKADLAGVGNLPAEYAQDIIHPEHYSVLPFVFRERVDTEPPARLAHEWVTALHARWSAAEDGVVASSGIPLLGDFPASGVGPLDVEAIERRARAAYSTFHTEKDRFPDDRYLKALKGYPRLMTATAGGTKGSLYVRQVRRIQRLRETAETIRSQALAEQEFLREYYADFDVVLKEPFEIPKMGVITGPVPHEDFLMEKARYEKAEQATREAKASPVRSKLFQWANADVRGRASVVWLGTDGALAPALLAGRLALAPAGADNLLENARYATGATSLPPPPKPKPVINMLDVDLLVYAKREELRACYEAALRRDKGVGGTVEWLLEIDPSGTPRGVKVAKSDIQDREFLLCLRDRVRTWNFPAPKGGDIAFRYPFRFRKATSSSKDP